MSTGRRPNLADEAALARYLVTLRDAGSRLSPELATAFEDLTPGQLDVLVGLLIDTEQRPTPPWPYPQDARHGHPRRSVRQEWHNVPMAVAPLDELVRLMSEGGLLDDPVVDEDIVHGRARLEAAGADVTVNIDPELDEVDDPDSRELADAVERILGIGEARWRTVIDAAATEIEEAVAGDGEIAEQVDLREDMEIRSVVVFADAVLLSFAATRQFPDSRILVQLDEDFEIENVEVTEDDDVETLEFSSLDELLDHISGPEAS